MDYLSEILDIDKKVKKNNMDAPHKTYDFKKSAERIDSIIETSDNSFEELKEIPSRSKLTYKNGFYVKCSALFIDIRGSSDLTNEHKRPKLAKLYRSYISEVVAVLCGCDICEEIEIVGDGILGIFNTPKKPDIDKVFSVSAELSSLVDIINFKFSSHNITQIEVGIGLDWGRALMIKAGYSGSGINNVVWIGDVVNQAVKLSGYGNKEASDKEIMFSNDFRFNLNEYNQGLLSKNWVRDCYHGNVINTSMNNWLKEQKKAKENPS